jgi:endo-1,4-beta-xylanase
MKLSFRLIALALVAAARVVAADDHPVVPLWPNGAPGSEARMNEPEKITGNNVSNIHNPSLMVFLPDKDKATGCAVIVSPGGGHRNLSYKNEGLDIAKWLADHGIAAFILKYRLGLDDANPKDKPQPYKFDVEGTADGQRSVRLVRSRAAEWGVNPDAIGMIGFSACGEIVAQVMMHPDLGKPDATDPLDRVSAKLNFQGLIYPGKSGLIKPVKDSPPAFLACGFKDRQDISEGLAQVYLLFKQAGVSTDFHVYAGASHGFGAREIGKSPPGAWVDSFRAFLVDQKFIPAGR